MTRACSTAGGGVFFVPETTVRKQKTSKSYQEILEECAADDVKKDEADHVYAAQKRSA